MAKQIIKGTVIYKSDIETSYRNRRINQVAHDYICIETESGETEKIGCGWVNDWNTIKVGDKVEISIGFN